MISVSTKGLANADLARLADLQVRCLPESLISLFGHSYTRRFYRYAARSDLETVFCARIHDTVVGGGVLSYAPATLTRRLLTATPLLLWAPVIPWRAPLRRAALDMLRDKHGEMPDGVPELLLIFTAPEVRGQGVGRAVLERCARTVEDAGHDRYVVRTTTDPESATVKFYLAAGFRAAGRLTHAGQDFSVYEKNLSRERRANS